MESSKSKVKSADRTKLYFNKFEYKVEVNSPHMFYSYWCENIDDYRAKIKEICDEYDQRKDDISWITWRRPRPDVEEWEYELVEQLLNLSKKYKIKKDYTVRRENNTWNTYTNDINIVNDILSFYPTAKITKVNLMPTGIMFFKREPPAKYRAYFTNNKMPEDFRDDFLSYIERTPDVRPSKAFDTFLKRSRRYNWGHIWLWDNYFIDYDDDKNLMMLMLMFPNAIGRKYKLEKK